MLFGNWVRLDKLPNPLKISVCDWDPCCCLCSTITTLWHILIGYKVSISWGRYTWKQNQVHKVLQELVQEAFESKKNQNKTVIDRAHCRRRLCCERLSGRSWVSGFCGSVHSKTDEGCRAYWKQSVQISHNVDKSRRSRVKCLSNFFLSLSFSQWH